MESSDNNYNPTTTATATGSTFMTSPKGVNKPVPKSSFLRDELIETIPTASTSISSAPQEVLDSPQPSSSAREDFSYRRQLFPPPPSQSLSIPVKDAVLTRPGLATSFESNLIVEKKINVMIDNFEQTFPTTQDNTNNNNNNSNNDNNNSNNSTHSLTSLPPAIKPAMKNSATTTNNNNNSSSFKDDHKYQSTEVASSSSAANNNIIIPAIPPAAKLTTSLTAPSSSSSSSSSIPPVITESDLEEFNDLKQAVRPVTRIELEESLELLRYDIHREVQEIIKEQVRQFSIARVSIPYHTIQNNMM